ncbi:MAG: TonB-dependent receptor, partial [Asticcacaulis sp.]
MPNLRSTTSHLTLRHAVLALVLGLAPMVATTAQAQATQPAPDTPAHTPAQTTPPEDDTSGWDMDLVVTSQKRATSLQKVPFSVSALTGDQARDLSAKNLVDLSRNVAGLAIADLGPGVNMVAIRGLSSGQVVRDESSRKETVGIYLDESAISLPLFTPDLDLFDFARVETLRGPQGTLFGAGSLGGTLRLITKPVKMNSFESVLEADISKVMDGSNGYGLKGMVNMPLIDDKLALRAVAYHNDLAGYVDAWGKTGGKVEDVNSGLRQGYRIAAEFRPHHSLTLIPRIVYNKTDMDGYPRMEVFNIFRNPHTTTRPAANFGDLEQYRQIKEGLFDETFLADLNINYDMGRLSLTSVTSFLDRDINMLQDGTALTSQVTAVAVGIPASAGIDAPLHNQSTLEAFSQEFRLSTNTTDGLQWVLGAFYTKQKKGFGQRAEAKGFEAAFNAQTNAGLSTAALSAPLSSDRDVLFISDFDIDFNQIAIFGEANYSFTDKLTGTMGLRWYKYEEDRNAIIAGFLNDGPTPTNLRKRSTEDKGFSPRFILSYAATDNISVNVQASRGFRLGGINDPLSDTLCAADRTALGGRDIEKYDSETATNYEIGLKSKLAGGKVTFNAAAYQIDSKDMQVSVRLACSSTIILNVPKARSRGFELEVAASPTRNLNLGASVGYNDAEVTSGVGYSGITKGMRLPTAPKLQAS